MQAPSPAAVAPLTENPPLDLAALLADRGVSILVCTGAGGVGKTTTAAALGVHAAQTGRQVCVMTIDPARRLAQSLGLTELDNEPRTVRRAAQLADDASDGAGTGRLDAMMLDMKRTFDEFVLLHAPAERARTILDNPFYQALSTSFAGTQEYMAMEKLGQLHATTQADGTWDLLIVDTPPARSALDFLDAPRRLGSFLDSRLMRLLTTPAKLGGRAATRVLAAGVGAFGGALTRVLGSSLLADIAVFVTALDSVFGGFQQRAEATFSLLQQPSTRFLVIAAPERDPLREAGYFIERLQRDGMPLAGLVLNRVVRPEPAELSAEVSIAGAEHLEQSPAGPADGVDRLVGGLLRGHADLMRTRARQAAVTTLLTGAHPEVPVAEVPALAGDVHDLPGLRAVARALTATGGPSA